MIAFKNTDVVATDRRARMIATQLVARGIRDERVIRAMLDVPRERFIPAAARANAYDDGPQGIGCGQTISQPYVVAYMLELLDVHREHRVLEVGTGTGYQAALLSRLASEVITVERHATLAEEARCNLDALGITNCDVRLEDGSRGVPDRAPFDRIIVAASGPHVPTPLVDQLAPGGRLICPVGDRVRQRLVRVTRSVDGVTLHHEDLDAVVFVPLIGQEGWNEP